MTTTPTAPKTARQVLAALGVATTSRSCGGHYITIGGTIELSPDDLHTGTWANLTRFGESNRWRFVDLDPTPEQVEAAYRYHAWVVSDGPGQWGAYVCAPGEFEGRRVASGCRTIAEAILEVVSHDLHGRIMAVIDDLTAADVFPTGWGFM